MQTKKYSLKQNFINLMQNQLNTQRRTFFHISHLFFLIVIGSLIIGSTTLVNAQHQTKSEEDELNEAIQETQKQLKDSSSRESLVTSDAAKEVYQRVKEMSGSEANEQLIYELSADILGNFKGKSSSEISKILEAASKNPEKFAQSLTPEQKKRIKEIAEKLPASQNNRKSH